MEALSCGGRASCHVDDDRKAGFHDGRAGCKGFGYREAFVGDGDRDFVCADTAFCEVDCGVKASGKCTSTPACLCAHCSANSSTIDCKIPFYIESDADAVGNVFKDIHGVGCCCASAVGHAYRCLSDSPVACRSPLYIESEASCEVGYGEQAFGNEAFCKVGCCSCAGSHVRSPPGHQVDGATSFHASSNDLYDVGYDEKDTFQAFHVLGSGVEGCSNTGLPLFCDTGNGEFQGWASPRLSFSCDFVMVDREVAAHNATQGSSSRLSPEKRKWEQQDDYPSDFEFLRNEPMGEGPIDTASGYMLSADELFSNGKLLPLPFPTRRASFDDFCLPSSSVNTHQLAATLPIHKSSTCRPMVRHLSLDLPKPSCTASHLTFACASPSPPRTTPASISSSSLPSTSPLPPKLSSLVPSSLMSSSSSPSFKYSAKIKEIFKFKKVSTDSSPSELTRDNSFTTTCRLPISPKSLWPFSRGGSICESKTGTTSLVCETIIDGAMEATALVSVALVPSQNSDGDEDERADSSLTSECPKIHGSMASINEENSDFVEPAPVMQISDAETASLEIQPHLHLTLNSAAAALEDAKENLVITPASRLRLVHGSASEISKKKASGTSSFARGSPSRRGGTIISPGVKVNAGKIVLRNLERCSTEKKLGMDAWKGLNKVSSYPAATRVSPVLNVGIYRGGNPSKNGFFSFGSLFSSRKNKKPIEAAINWRKGA